MRTKMNRLLTLGAALICFGSVASASSSNSSIDNQMTKMEVSTSASSNSSFFSKAKAFFVNGSEELAYKYNETIDALTVRDVEAYAGEQCVLPVYLDNSSDITGIQFDLYLPQGVTVAQNDRSRYRIDFVDGRNSYNHTIASKLQSDGALRVLSYSPSNEIFSGNSGAVFNIILNVSPEVKEGNYNVEIKNIVLSTPNVERITPINSFASLSVATYKLGDVNNDRNIDVTDISGLVALILGSSNAGLNSMAADINKDQNIDVTDISGVVNMILTNSAYSTPRFFASKKSEITVEKGDIQILPFTLKANEEKTVQVLLKSAPDTWFVQAQFDFYLPEGISVKTKKMGPKVKLCIDKGALSSLHSVSSLAQENDRHVRVVVSSTANDPFYPESQDIDVQEGEIATITLCGAPDLKEGIHELRINKVVLATDHNTNAKPEEYTTSVVAGNPVAKEVALKGHFTPESAQSVSLALNSKEITTVDLTQAIAIDANTTFTTGNPNTLYYLVEGMNLSNNSNVVVGSQCQQLSLTDGFDFNTTKEFVAQNASYSRTIANDGWYSICLPYASNVGPDVVVEKFVSLDDAKATAKFEKAVDMQANMPYIFKAKADVKFEASNVTVPVATTFNEGIFCGTLSEMNALQGKFALRNDGTGFGVCGADAVASAFRAYLDADLVQANTIKINHGQTTAIENTQIEENLFPANIYTVDGKLVKKQANDMQGLEHGIYIVKGNKIIK